MNTTKIKYIHKKTKKQIKNINILKGSGGVLSSISNKKNKNNNNNKESFELQHIISKETIKLFNSDHVSKKIEFINQFGLPIIIILGAYNYETHILEFMSNLDTQTTVICIRYDDVYDKNKDNIIKNDNGYIISFINNFNEISLWEELKKLNNINKIIVDLATAKFFEDEYSFVSGRIMQIIFNMLPIGGRFYSECCFSIRAVENSLNKNIKWIPQLFKYAIIPKLRNINSSKKALRMTATEWNNLIRPVAKITNIGNNKFKKQINNDTEKYITKYKDYLQYYKPLNYTLEFKKPKDNGIDLYPLKNSSKEYFYLEKIND